MYSYTDLSIIPDNAYKFAQFIEGGCYDNIIYYEFHQEVNPAEIYNCIEGLEEFNNRSGSLHKIFFAYDLVDQVPAIIHVALKMADEWFIARDCGANFYLGYGPCGILELRKACEIKGVMSFLSTESFDKWIEDKFGKAKSPLTSGQKKEDAAQFKTICRKLEHLAVDMQNQPEIYKDLKEENIRSKMKTPLNTIFEGRVSAEAKNCKGKTDILIKTKNGLNEHIFELKIWRGIKTLESAITQLNGYLGWHNNFCGIIIFSYRQGFTNILTEIHSYLLKNYEEIHRHKEGQFTFQMVHDKDNKKKIEIRLVLINLKC